MYITIPLKKKMDNFIVLNDYIGQGHFTINKKFIKNLSECHLKGNVLNGNRIELPQEQENLMSHTLAGFIDESIVKAVPQYKLCFCMDNEVMAMPFICDGTIILINIDLIRMIEKNLIGVKYYASGKYDDKIVAKVDNEVIGIFCGMRYQQEELLNAVQALAQTKTCRIFEEVNV